MHADQSGLDEQRTLDVLGRIYSAEGRPFLPVERTALVLASALEDLGADAGFVAVLSEDGQTLEAVRVTAYSRDFVRLAFPIQSPYPLAAAVRQGRSLFLGSNAELACEHHPGLVRIESQDHACATVPLLDPSATIIGAINVTFDEPRTFRSEDQAAIEELAAACSAELTLT